MPTVILKLFAGQGTGITNSIQMLHCRIFAYIQVWLILYW